LDGVLYITGGRPDNYADPRNEIFTWTGEDWVEVGKMKMPRHHHAVSIIEMDEEFCVSSGGNSFVAIHWLFVILVINMWQI